MQQTCRSRCRNIQAFQMPIRLQGIMMPPRPTFTLGSSGQQRRPGALQCQCCQGVGPGCLQVRLCLTAQPASLKHHIRIPKDSDPSRSSLRLRRRGSHLVSRRQSAMRKIPSSSYGRKRQSLVYPPRPLGPQCPQRKIGPGGPIKVLPQRCHGSLTRDELRTACLRLLLAPR
jgi:hypothetical protein